MKEFKGTKGEWLIERSGLTEMGYDIDTCDNSTLIARVGTKADATLIASAPDLLRACIEAEKHHQGGHSEIGHLLREAIKKALG